MKAKIAFILLSILSLATTKAADNRFTSAGSLYQSGKFSEAASAYEDILKTGIESEALYFNLGNAYYKAGNLPRAIINYERAKLIDPDDKDVIYNLDLANSQTADRISPVGDFFLKTWMVSIINKGTSDFWTWVAIMSFFVVLVAAGFYLYSNSTDFKRISFFGGLGFALVFITTISFAYSQKSQMTQHNEAIVFTPSVSVKSSPDNSGTDIFVIHEGTKIKILETLGQWKKIQVLNGAEGWIPSDSFEII